MNHRIRHAASSIAGKTCPPMERDIYASESLQTVDYLPIRQQHAREEMSKDAMLTRRLSLTRHDDVMQMQPLWIPLHRSINIYRSPRLQRSHGLRPWVLRGTCLDGVSVREVSLWPSVCKQCVRLVAEAERW